MKYLLKESNEIIEFGDEIMLEGSKELSDGRKRFFHLSGTFSPLMVDALLEEGIIEEVDDEEDNKNDTVDQAEYLAELEGRIDALDEMYDELEQMYNMLSDELEELKQATKPEPVKPKAKTQNGKGKNS